MGADAVNIDEFNATVFEQISNTYQKTSSNKPAEETIHIHPPHESDSTTTHPEDHHDGEGDYDEEEHSDGSSDSPVATVSERKTRIKMANENDFVLF